MACQWVVQIMASALLHTVEQSQPKGQRLAHALRLTLVLLHALSMELAGDGHSDAVDSDAHKPSAEDPDAQNSYAHDSDADDSVAENSEVDEPEAENSDTDDSDAGGSDAYVSDADDSDA